MLARGMDQSPIAQLFLRYLWISGRSSRLEWWLVHFGGLAAFTINDAIFTVSSHPLGIAGITFHVVRPIWWYINYLLIWISFASIVRRLHDRNKSGWWAVFYVIPIIGWAWCFIECGFLPGHTPPAEPPAPAGAMQRAQPRPWTPMRVAKTAGNVVGLGVIGLIFYIWFTAPPPTFDSDKARQHVGLQPEPAALPE
jgi:uncharacterized membrane protein YhaH (DUF805 family)